MSNNNVNYDKTETCIENDCSNKKNIYKYNDITFCCKKYKGYDNGILDFKSNINNNNNNNKNNYECMCKYKKNNTNTIILFFIIIFGALALIYTFTMNQNKSDINNSNN